MIHYIQLLVRGVKNFWYMLFLTCFLKMKKKRK